MISCVFMEVPVPMERENSAEICVQELNYYPFGHYIARLGFHNWGHVDDKRSKTPQRMEGGEHVIG